MIVFFYLIAFALIVLDYAKNRRLSSPVFIYTQLWIFIVTLASMGLYSFSGYSEEVLIIVIVGTLCFGIGNFNSLKVSACSKRNLTGIDSTTNGKHMNIILALTTIGTIFSIYYTSRAFFNGATYLEIRGSLLNYNDDQIIGNRAVSAFITYFCGPAETVLLPLAIMFSLKKEHKTFRRIVYFDALCGGLASGGRITFLYAIIQFIVAAGYYHKKVSKKTKKRILRLTLVLLVIIVILTNLRSRLGIWFQIYSYFSLPMGLLTHYVDILKHTDFNSYGASTFYPLFYVANSITSFMGVPIDFLNDLVYYVGLPQKQWVRIFPQTVNNAFCSLYYFFYMDFRIPGVIIFTYLYGFVTGIIYNMTFKKHNELGLLLYLMIVRTLFSSFIIWQLGNTKFFVSTLILIWGCRMDKTRIKNKAMPSSEGGVISNPLFSFSFEVAA